MARQKVYTTAEAGGELLREKAVVLLGNPETWRLVVMQDDYYWLEVTSCCPPHEAHHCGVCGGCCVELSPGNLPQKRNKGLILNTHTHMHTEKRDFSVNEELNKLIAKNNARIPIPKKEINRTFLFFSMEAHCCRVSCSYIKLLSGRLFLVPFFHSD